MKTRSICSFLIAVIPLLSLDPIPAETPGPREMVEREDLQIVRVQAINAWRRVASHGSIAARLPLPRTTAPPKIDGRPDDPCWQTATSVFDAAEYWGLDLAEPVMRYRFCADDAKLYIALDARMRRSKGGTSDINIHACGKDMRIEFNAKQAAHHGPAKGERSPWLEWGRFVGNEEAGCYEIAIPMAELYGREWKKDGLRVLFHFDCFAGGDLTHQRWIHLVDSDLALQINDVKRGSLSATIIAPAERDVNLQAEADFLRDSDLNKAERLAATPAAVKKGGQTPINVKYQVPFHEGVGAVRLALKGEGVEYRYSICTATLPIAPIVPKIEALLKTYGDGAAPERFKEWQARAREVADRLAALRARPEPGAWQALYRTARSLQREILLAQLPPDLDEVLFVKRYPYTAGGRWFTTHYHFEPGGHNLCIYSIKTGNLRNILNVPDHTALRDPDLHFDGKRIIFCARSKKSEIFKGFSDDLHDVWSIYEVNSDGTGLRRITKSEAYDLEPVYLPNDTILFGSLRSNCWGCCTGHSAYNFHVMDADGKNVRRFTSNYLYDVAASVMPDGRIVFLRWVHEDKPGNHINALWTARQDGTGLAGFFGMNVYGCFIEPRGIPGANEVVCIDSGESGHWRLPQNGHLGIIAPAISRDVLAHRIETPLPFGGGWGFKTPYPLTTDLFLVSFGNLWHGFGVYVVDRQGNMELLYKDPKLSCVNAVPFAPRVRPPVTSSPATAEAEGDSATVAILDVYNALPGIERGTVKAIRVVQVPDKDIVNNGNSHWADQTIAVAYVYRMVRKVLGETPVADDGSAYFKVPAGKAVYFQLLDKDGLMVQTMRDTTSFRPGEKVSCIGCHEPRERAPNLMPEPMALRRPAVALTPPEGGPRGVSFPRDIQPILDRHCVRCHDVTKPDGGVILSGDVTETFNVAYEALNQHNRDWGHSRHPKMTPAIVPVITYVAEAIPPRSSGAYASPLLRKYVFGKHYDVKMAKEEIATVALWVDLNLPYYDDWDSKRYEGGRNIRLTAETMKLIRDVCGRRCAECHAKGKPLAFDVGLMVNLSRPELSKMLYASLAAEAGGMGKEKMAVFRTKADPDYQAVLKALQKERTRIPSLVTSALDKGPGGVVK
ncbi:MAG: hypothetical protein AB1696_18390 [Planctomycetota bacterium]